MHGFPKEFGYSLLVNAFFWIGLSSGQISQVIVGDQQQQYLLVIGRDVDDVQLAQHLAQANEIVCPGTAESFVNSTCLKWKS